MYTQFAQKIIYPLADIALNTSVMKYYHWLEETQWWSQDQLHEYQNSRLKSLLAHVYQNVPYYTNLFNIYQIDYNEIGIDNIGKLPILTKSDVRSKTDILKANNFNRFKPVLNSTGGSTGVPLQYFITKESASLNWAGNFRGWNWAGFKIGDKRISLGGSSLVPDTKMTLFQKTRYFLERNIPLSAVSLDDKKCSEYISVIKRNKIKYIYGYPSSIYVLADYCKTHTINDIYFQAVFTTAEVLLPQYRKLIEEQFRCKVYDQYGSYDGGAQALECEAHCGLHITVETSIVEILDKNDKPVLPGVPGRIIVTDLHNYAMPFIRYDVGDIGIIDGNPCICGRGLPLLKAVQGRTTDIIRLSNGKIIAGPAVTLMFKDCRIKQYQLVQKSGNALVIKVVKDIGYSDQDEALFLNTLKYHAGEDTRIDIEYCTHIISEGNGKLKFIKSDIY